MNHTTFSCIYRIENPFQFLLVQFDMLVDQTRPVEYHVREILVEILEINLTFFMSVHQSKRELVAFLVTTVAKDIHDSRKLRAIHIPTPVFIKARIDSIC